MSASDRACEHLDRTRHDDPSRVVIMDLLDEIAARDGKLERMEVAGLSAIDALKAVSANGSLSDAQRRLVDVALDTMFSVRERWRSQPSKM